MKKNPILSAAGQGPKQYGKTRRGSWSQHPSSCTISPKQRAGEKPTQRHISKTAQVRLCLSHRALCQSKADHLRTWCCNGADVPSWTSGQKRSTVQKPEKRKVCSKTDAPSTECSLAQWASDSDFSALAHSVMQVFSLLPMVTPPPAPWKEKC